MNIKSHQAFFILTLYQSRMNYLNENKTLLILDIDETLLFGSRETLSRRADFNIFDYNIYKRPYLAEFIESVKDDFILAIWSSASDDYVQEIVKHIIPETVELAFIWGRSRCTYKPNWQIDEYGYYEGNYFDHYQFIKPLKKLKNKGYTLERILIVDDPLISQSIIMGM